MPQLLQLQKLPGKGDAEWEKVSLRFILFYFLTLWLIASSWEKMRFGASYSTSNRLLLVARHILITVKNVFKVGSVKFANSLSSPSNVKKVRTESKSSQGT